MANIRFALFCQSFTIHTKTITYDLENIFDSINSSEFPLGASFTVVIYWDTVKGEELNPIASIWNIEGSLVGRQIRETFSMPIQNQVSFHFVECANLIPGIYSVDIKDSDGTTFATIPLDVKKI